MKLELDALIDFLSQRSSAADQPKLAGLSQALSSLYCGHWYPEEPERGSAFRALTAGHPALPLSLHLGPNWTIWVDPGCVAWKSDDSTLQEIYGSLPSVLCPAPFRSDAAKDGSLATISPVKRSSHAIQIVRPHARKPSAPFPLSAPSLEIAPPTPVPMPHSSGPYAVPESPCRSVSPASVASLIERPASRTSSASSSSAVSSLFSYKRPAAHHRSSSSISVISTATSASSQSSVITRPASACSVTEHSNGKVGVLGGGVLLGLPAGATAPSGSSSDDSSENDDEAVFSSAPVDPAQTHGGKRRRSRHRAHHRTSSSSGSGSISRLQAQGSAQLFRQWNMQKQWAQTVFQNVAGPYPGAAPEATPVF